MQPLTAARLRATAEATTVLVATAVAVLAIMLPISFSSLAAAQHLDLLVFNVPRAMTASAFVAVLTAAVTVAVGSVRTARWTTLLALVGILVNHLVLLPLNDGRNFNGLSLPTLNFIDALLAGVAFGALAVAVWGTPLLRAVYLFAALGATVIGDLTQTPVDVESHGFAGLLISGMPLWFIAASVLGLAYFAITEAPPPRFSPDTAIPLAPVFAAVLAYSTILVSSLSLAAHKSSAVYLILGSLAVVAAATAAAFVLPDRDGILVLLLTAYAVVGSLVITLPRSGWVDVATLGAVGVGLLAGLRASRVRAAAVCVIALGAFTLACDVFTPPAALAAAVGCLALGAVGGFCVGTAVPVSASSGVVALAILFVPSVGVALSDSSFGHLAYSPSWYRTAVVDRGAVPATVGIGIALGCSAAVLLLLRHRPLIGPQPVPE
ncbi:hypothetical protein ACFXK0_00535 [Nocardia sp. NPDC059177]|uniref:hypothetical protein n=1 Tax=Nocardia sp. NPDC059177 TaxID=3346759 RepID=UPI0036AAF9CA